MPWRRWALDPGEMRLMPPEPTHVPAEPSRTEPDGASKEARRAGSPRAARPPAEPVTVTVARRVAPGRACDFEDWASGILAVAARFPGFLGGGVLRPGEAGREWHVVYRFASNEALHAWEASSERAAWLERAESLMDETAVSRVSGLETWFALPGRTAPAPPRPKMWVVTLLAIYPLALLLNAVVGPLLGDLPLPVRTLVFSGALVTLMTWVVMPRMTRLFRSWLYRDVDG